MRMLWNLLEGEACIEFSIQEKMYNVDMHLGFVYCLI